ncbi:MAG: hypothetical protein H6Q89_2690 [Myxococcaceae bacterium]|nr:hypothetical protein [Myxococcaceae bacterium]
MKIPLAAVTLAIAGLLATPVNPPASKLAPAGTGRRVMLMPPLELNPHTAQSRPVPLGTLRETSASGLGARLDRLDDRVSALKARADLAALRVDLAPDFERLRTLREKVQTALRNLRNPALGLDAAESAVSTALNELELAIDQLGLAFERLEQPLRVS